MRALLLLLFVFLQAPASQPAAVLGIVVREGSAEPIQGAVVSIAREGSTPRTGTSGEDGRFGIADIAPGRYEISVSRTGFVRSKQFAGPASITLAAGEVLREIRIQLAPTAVLSGRVMDDNSNPVSKATITLYEVRYESGRRILLAARGGNRPQTDDRGEYRIFGVPEGTYYIEALATGFATNYYPGVADLGDAIEVKAPAGAQVSGVDFRLRSSQRYSARFNLVRPAQRASSFVTGMYIFRQNRNGVLTMHSVGMSLPPQAQGTPSAAPETFTTPPLAPGSYVAVYDAGSQIGRLAFDIADRDRDIGTMIITDGVALSGRLRLTGSAPEGWAIARVQVSLTSLDFRGSLLTTGMQSRVAADGAFMLAMPAQSGTTDRAPSVAQGRYQVEVTGLAGDLYLSSASLAGFDVLRDGLKIDGSSSGPLELTIENGGAIEGLASNEKNEPMPDVRIALIPALDRRTNLLLFKSTSSDQHGRFSLRGVAPGEYTVLAWEDVPAGAWMNAEFVSPFERYGTRVLVSAGATAITGVRVIRR